MSARAAQLRPRPSTRPTDLRVVRRRATSHIKRTGSTRIAPVAIAVTIGVAAIIAAILLEQVALAQSAFRLSDLRTEYQEAGSRHEELLLEAAQLDSSARIERYARETLGMVDPDPAAVHYIVANVRRGKSHARPPSSSPALGGPGIAAGSPYGEVPAEGTSP